MARKRCDPAKKGANTIEDSRSSGAVARKRRDPAKRKTNTIEDLEAKVAKVTCFLVHFRIPAGAARIRGAGGQDSEESAIWLQSTLTFCFATAGPKTDHAGAESTPLEGSIALYGARPGPRRPANGAIRQEGRR